jgi:hypothetical protein
MTVSHGWSLFVDGVLWLACARTLQLRATWLAFEFGVRRLIRLDYRWRSRGIGVAVTTVTSCLACHVKTQDMLDAMGSRHP